MFLKELRNDEQKMLFIFLATLIMMAEGDKQTTASLIRDRECEDYTEVFLESFSVEELLILGQYYLELGVVDDDYDDKSTEDKIDLIANDVINDGYGGAILSESIEMAVDKYSEQEDIKKTIATNLIANGVDILKITPDVIKMEILKFPEIKAEVLESSVQNGIKEFFEKTGMVLSGKEKKIILFELIGAGFSSGRLEDAEKNLLIKICECLEIEAEYVDEFLEVAGQLFMLNKEIVDLINE